MAEPWAEVASEAFGVLKDSLKNYVERQEVDEFAKERIAAYAREWWAAKTASDDATREEHEKNLKHLVAQARGEARRLQIGISEEAKDTIGRILETLGGVLIRVIPKVAALL